MQPAFALTKPKNHNKSTSTTTAFSTNSLLLLAPQSPISVSRKTARVISLSLAFQ